MKQKTLLFSFGAIFLAVSMICSVFFQTVGTDRDKSKERRIYEKIIEGNLPEGHFRYWAADPTIPGDKQKIEIMFNGNYYCHNIGESFVPYLSSGDYPQMEELIQRTDKLMYEEKCRRKTVCK